jgi:exonuclease SbcC
MLLENRRLEFQKQLAELSVFERRAKQDETDLKNLRNEYQEVKQRLQEIETLKDVAESLENLETQRNQVELAMRNAQASLERLSLKTKEQKRAKENLAKIKGEITTLESELLNLQQIQEQANALVELESKEVELNQSVTELRLRIVREQQFVSEIQNGLCPLLSQRCLNMKEGQPLDTHFIVQIEKEEHLLHRLEAEQQENRKKLAVSKSASRKLSGLEEKRVNLERHKQEYGLEQRNIANLQKEIDKVITSEQQLRQLSEQQANLQTALQQAQAAKVKYEGIEPLRARLQQLTIEGQQRREAWAALQAHLARIPTIEKEQQDIEARLSRLDDPRTRLISIERELKKEGGLREELLLLSEQTKTIKAEIESLTEQLSAFAALDATLLRLREQRALSSSDYQLYMQNRHLASMLQAREKEQAEIQSELEQFETKLLEINEAIMERRMGYNADLHLSLKGKLEELIGKNAALASELSLAEKRREELQQAIDQLLDIRKAMLELMQQKDREEQVGEATDFMRELLKKAGPFITEAHLQSISIEANQLYRDITGNPMVSLRWDTGYEIIVEEEGHEKGFLNLSGGEKMSAALSVRLALLKELSDIRIAFFDEPTANMDEERRRNLAQQIGAIKDFEQLFVVSHDDTFEGFTDRVVTIRRET